MDGTGCNYVYLETKRNETGPGTRRIFSDVRQSVYTIIIHSLIHSHIHSIIVSPSTSTPQNPPSKLCIFSLLSAAPEWRDGYLLGSNGRSHAMLLFGIPFVSFPCLFQQNYECAVTYSRASPRPAPMQNLTFVSGFSGRLFHRGCRGG